MNKPEIRINESVPEPVLRALANVRGHFSSIEHVFHCICIDRDKWVGVAGDGENGGYEHFVFAGGKLTISDVSYGDTTIALRDVLTKEVQ